MGEFDTIETTNLDGTKYDERLLILLGGERWVVVHKVSVSCCSSISPVLFLCTPELAHLTKAINSHAHGERRKIWHDRINVLHIHGTVQNSKSNQGNGEDRTFYIHHRVSLLCPISKLVPDHALISSSSLVLTIIAKAKIFETPSRAKVHR